MSGLGSKEIAPDPRLLLPVAQSPLLTQRLLRLRAYRSHLPVTRRKREMTPTDKKDAIYWDKRRKNNDAAKRSREKKRLSDLMMEGQLLALSEENAQLRAEMLSLQYHMGLGRGISKAAADSTPSPSAVASMLSFPHNPAHLQHPSTALFHAGLWGSSTSNSASVLGVRPHEAVNQPGGSRVSSLASGRAVGGSFDPHSPRSSSASGHYGSQQGIFNFPSVPLCSPLAASENGGSVVEETDAHQQVSSSSDTPNATSVSSHSTSSIQAFLPTPDSLHSSSTLCPTSHLPQNWLIPHMSHSAVCSNLLLPWRSPCLTPPALYPTLPLYMPIEERQLHGLGLETDIHRGFRGGFNSVPAELAQLKMHISPDRR